MSLKPSTDFKLLYCTTASPGEARTIGRQLVQQHLAACVNILPAMNSIYRWEGNIEEATEAVLIVKTVAAKAKAVVDHILAHHSYECPAILVLPIEAGSADYLHWLQQQIS